jgi:hypothetical protein
LSGNITPSCSNLPNNTVCRFLPTTITVSGTTPVGVSAEIYTNVSPGIAAVQSERNNMIAFAILGPWGLGLLVLARKRRRAGFRVIILLLLIACGISASVGLTGCTQSSMTPATPTGTQNISISFSSAGTTTVTHSLSFSLTVNTP